MSEALHFVFSSFWIWLGTLILVCAFGGTIASILLAARGKESE